MTISARQYISKSTIQYKLRLMHNQEEIQGQKVIIANDITKQNISVSKQKIIMKLCNLSQIIIYFFL